MVTAISPLARLVLLIVVSSLVPQTNAQGLEPEFEISVDFVPESELVENSYATHTAHVTVVCTEYSPRMQTGNMVFTPYVYVKEAPEELDIRHMVGKLSFVFQLSDCENRVEKQDFFNVTINPGNMRGLAPVSMTIGLVADQGTGNGSTEWETRTAIVGGLYIPPPVIISKGERTIDDEVRIHNEANLDVVVEISLNRTKDSLFKMEPVRFGPIPHRGDDIIDIPIKLAAPPRVQDNEGAYPLHLDVRIEAADPAGYHIETQTVTTDVRIRHDDGPGQREIGLDAPIGWLLLGGLLLIASRHRRHI
ncbi:MAG: hypothetical protein KY455_02095 [Euryarchaeota archaeon]|nr:hypothetical protein [Euryarchaeota archaeon]